MSATARTRHGLRARAAGCRCASFLLVWALAASTPAASAAAFESGASAPARQVSAALDRVDRALAYSTPNGLFRTELSGLFDLEGYYVDERPPGLIFGSEGFFASPRLSLFLDTHVGRHLYSLVQARFDRGFDPRSRSSGSARFDEYLLRFTPEREGRANIQIGKFATIVGNWVARHDSWNNPFVNAPLPYENVTTITDGAAPASADAFLARRDVPDRKREWVPVIWGPSYASGASLFGRLVRFDYAFEVKNAALASRPEEWDGRARGWRDPTFSGRVGWQPTPAWDVGASISSGSYFRRKARETLPAGRALDDFSQDLVGADLSYAWRHFQLWAELFLARFDVPRVGEAEVATYYLEGRYKLTPQLFAGLRWNQQFFGDVEDGAGHERAWDRDMWRVDAVAGYRFDRHLQGKLQYGYSRQTGSRQQGEQLVALQLTLKF